jgi:DNA helicase-2/ATP-dependent DNA helicase PcrA
MLRQRGDPQGRGRDFVIYDEDDQRSLVKRVMRELEVSDREFPPARLLERISRLKSELIDVDEMTRVSMTHYDKNVARVYEAYQAALLKNNAMDFDDLLVNTVLLLSGSEDARRHYSERFKHVLVDEYQDTNHAQYRILAELCRDRRNLCVVGDDDQSIYGWRGADLRNILEFESNFPETKVIRLEQNYRSTGLILEAANNVIKHNKGRKGKTLRTENEYGERLSLLLLPGEEEEAESVAEEIAAEQLHRRTPLSQVAVLYRTNAQSRSLEIALRHAGINYQIVGAISFYERREVKDILAYLRLCVNPNDEVSLRRVLNVPPRRVGQTALERLEALARERGLTLFEALRHAAQTQGLPAATRACIADFVALMDRLSAARGGKVEQLVEAVLKGVGYREYLGKETTNLEDRLENVSELVASARQFDEESADRIGDGTPPGAAEEPEASPVSTFLSDISLVSQIDAWRPEEDRVTLMTAHNAKGLEFDCVFITGLEEGLFPHCASMDSDEEIEEERRLFYVALTRARKRAVLTAAGRRRRFDSFGQTGVSRFVAEIPDGLVSAKQLWEAETAGRFVGMEVLHQEFGYGRVVEQEGSGQKAKLTVQFPGNVVRKIVARYVQMKGT